MSHPSSVLGHAPRTAGTPPGENEGGAVWCVSACSSAKPGLGTHLAPHLTVGRDGVAGRVGPFTRK